MARPPAFPLLVAMLVVTPAAAADPPDLARARAAHQADLVRLGQKLLADLDAVIRTEKAAGVAVDYMLDERKAFADGGVVPILPKLRPAAQAYSVAKAKADNTLADALEKAGRTEEARRVRGDPGRRPEPELAKPVDVFQGGTVWVGTTTNKVDKLVAQPVTLVIVSRSGDRFRGMFRWEAPGGKAGFADVAGVVNGAEARWEVVGEATKQTHVLRASGGGLSYQWTYEGGSSGEGHLKLVRP